ncbi:MAG: NAD-dependent epimerase/dehydratase family protein [Myxococcales bacterium]
MRVAVLGATGMLGRHTAEAVLSAGHELVVVYRNPASLKRLEDLRFTGRQADLNDRAALEQALMGLDGLIHAAAYYPGAPRPWQDEVATALALNRNVYDAAESAKVPRLVYLGGAIALPRRDDGQPADGTERYAHEPASKNPYLQVKWAMDEQALQKAKAGLPVVIGIPAMTFGEHDTGSTTGQLITGIARGELKKYVRGERNVVYAGDAGRGLVMSLVHGTPGARYLLTGSNTNMDELTALIARVAGVKAPTAAPLAAARVLGGVQKLRYRFGGPLPVVSDSAIAVMSAGQHLSGARSEAIGYTPQVSLEDTISRAFHWAKAHGMC